MRIFKVLNLLLGSVLLINLIPLLPWEHLPAIRLNFEKPDLADTEQLLSAFLNIPGARTIRQEPYELYINIPKEQTFWPNFWGLKSVTLERIFYVLKNEQNLKLLHLWGKLQDKDIPKSIGTLKSLTGLDLYYNNFSVVPTAIAELTNLETLFIGTGIKEFPAILGKLPNMLHLHLYSNSIHSISNFDKNTFKKLKVLDLSNNNLEHLPDTLPEGTFEKLEELHLANNNLTHIPNWVLHLPNLKLLDVRLNFSLPVQEFSESISKRLEIKYF